MTIELNEPIIDCQNSVLLAPTIAVLSHECDCGE